MRKPAVCIFYLLFFILTLSGCKRKPAEVNLQSSWKSIDPLSIPISAREMELSKSNLILNPSFESGRYYNIDSSKISFILPGWEKVGNNVYWTDVQNEKQFGISEAYDGLHAIKIVRKNSDETDNQGEGIITDLIKVIPGNYKLSCHIRLEHIEPQISRIYSSLGDAVNIRIFFYDKNKVNLSSSVFNPVSNNFIDYSFKGFSFSNISYINKLGWGKVLGKTANYPFNEGDIPDNTQFVRIFFGLKGNGTMWIDKVNFEYSINNFSLLERTEAHFDSLVSPALDLIPAPKQMTSYSAEALRININDKLIDPVILIPFNAGIEIVKAAEKISNHLGIALKGKNKKLVSIRIINKLDPGMIESGRLIFSLGKTQAYFENADRLPLKEISGKHQGYFICSVPSMKRLVLIEASDNDGFIHACNTIIQLIHAEDQVYNHYNIVDYPDILTRAAIIPVPEDARNNKIISQIRDLTEIGFNLIYLQPEDVTVSSAEGLTKVQRFAPLVSEIRSSFPGTDLGISFLNIRFPKKVHTENVSSSLIKSSGNNNKLISEYLKTGFTKILITDESIWDMMNLGSKSVYFNLSTMSDFEEFIYLTDNYLQGLKDILKNNSFKENILFLPVLSTNENLTDSWGYTSLYFRVLMKYSDIIDGILWKGPTELPVQIDFVEVYYFRTASRQENYLFLNNLITRRENPLQSSYASYYPGKARLGSIFEALNIDMGSAPEAMNLPSFCLINQSNNSILSKIRLFTAADYIWNMKDYDASATTWKVLNRLYGRNRAIKLVQFNDRYYQLLQLCMVMEQEQFNQKNFKTAEELIMTLNTKWYEITRLFASELELLNELSDFKNQVIARFYRIKRPVTITRPGG
jgi:hypothetical protein